MHGHRPALLKLLDGRPFARSALLTIQTDDYARQFRAGAADHLRHLGHGRAGRDDIVNNQHAAAQWGAHQGASFPVVLGFFAIVGKRHVSCVVV